MMETVITSFRCPDTERLFHRQAVRRFESIADSGRGRLIRLNSAGSLLELAAVRGNKLEALKGDRQGQYSIRINDRWRICFRWVQPDAQDVEIVDYH